MIRQTLFYPNLTLDEAKKRIENGADVNEQNEHGMTPLFYVNNFEVAQLLIKHGVNVNHLNKYGRTPIFYAKNIDIVKLFIDNKAELNLFDIDGWTPLNTVNHASSANMLKLLIENGANLNISNIYGLTLLDQWSDPRTTQIIINYGAIPGKKATYKCYYDLFSKEQQNAFDMFLTLTSDDNDFFRMCLAYQDGIKNHVKMKIKDMDIL